ncbi:site-specific DNA-methyltransferase (adenine-specific)/modification methylase [Alkalibaculum bacchi]|jgi:site-specific DNA-methyltransferase (adenine-specific)|uniref:Methyltransferase n=1 Tax=Alkalibaculum bacchi TaxID=645887 RepID=A0A366I090_9FIRM|nr:site-specific DNA-methyltransferase [Alkalibaculum bacchi]RBP60387.1 site-specific DNA-methyltransferase (adenine-specific)/modification methylase [Alkalibaculum bacchi]
MKYTKNEITNRLFEGDCLEIMKTFPDKSIDMVLCDLPYGTTQNKWDSVIPLEELWDEYSRVVKDDGAIVLTSHGLFTSRLMLSNPNEFKYKWIWIKSKATNFLNSKKQPLRKYEEVCVFYKKQPTYNPQMMNGESYDKGIRKDQLSGSYGDFEPVRVKSNGDRYPVDLIYFKTAENEGTVFHPTQKPIGLGQYLIKTYTNKGDLVLDNTFGSGSFLVSALSEGRNFVGIEKNEETHQFKKHKYDLINVAYERLKNAWHQLPIEEREYIVKENIIKEFILND